MHMNKKLLGRFNIHSNCFGVNREGFHMVLASTVLPWDKKNVSFVMTVSARCVGVSNRVYLIVYRFCENEKDGKGLN